MVTNFISVFSRLRGDNKANVAVIFAVAILPIMASIGCAVDYSVASRLRAKLQSAADVASVGSIGRNSPAYETAGGAPDGQMTNGRDDAVRIFRASMSSESGFTLDSVTADVTKSGKEVSATVSFSATMKTSFMSIVGQPTVKLAGSSTAVSSVPTYIDFYLLLDNSPSMGVAATPDDVDKMVANTGDKCAFACHDLNDNNNYYKLAKKLGVTTRIDVVRSAAQKLMDTATATRTYSDQFRMSIYTFGPSASTRKLTTIAPLTADLSTAKSQASAIDLMTVNGQNEDGDQHTNFTTVFPQMNNEISSPGSGATNVPQKYLFFVSDGVADEYNTACLKPTTGGRCQSPLNPALCKTIKDRGIKIAVLYTTYLALPSNDWYNQWIGPFNAGPYGPSVNSEIAKNMKACATDGFYFEVSPTDGIAEAMAALFQKAVSIARISH